MSKKKITAPLSYDPGKGRPKEYLAYLNWQEMQALQKLNGGNMERGPRGLPSFPPDDAIGSNQTPGSGNWTGSPGGTSVGAGPGGDVGGTTESGNIGGAGTSTSTTSSAASSAASTTSAASQNTTDEAAQQAAAVNNAAAAARNAALNEDARRAGIGSIEVGPQRTPVSIGGGQVFGTISGMARQPSVLTGSSPPVPTARPGDLGSVNQMAQTAEGIMGVAQRLGIDPIDLGTVISYETAGTFDPKKPGPTTKYGQHKGYIQFGEPQAEQFGVDWSNPIESQLGPDGAVESYLKNAGVKPGMNMLDVYSAINAGRVGRYGASDTAAGGAPGNVANKVYEQMADHRALAEGLLSKYVSTGSAPVASVGSASAAEEAARRSFAASQLGQVYSDPNIKTELKNALAQSAWDTRIKDAQRIAMGQEPVGQFGEISPTHPLSGFRTLEQQKAISNYSKVSSPEKGYHTWGMAADVGPERLPGEEFNDYMDRIKSVNEEIAKNISDPNVAWAGNIFKKFDDPGHFQYGTGSVAKSVAAYGSPVQRAGVASNPYVANIEATPASVQLSQTESVYNPSLVSDPVAAATMAGLAQLPSVLSNFSIPSIPEGSAAQKNALSVARAIMPESAYQSMVNKAVADAVQQSGFSLADTISSGISALNKYAPSETVVATPDDSVVPQAPDYLPPDKARPKFVSPETVQIMEDQERKNRTGIKLMEKVPGAGGIAGLIERGQKLFTGKDIADYGTDLKREYLQADEDQKAAMRDKYPDIRRFAVSIGEIAPNTGIQNASAGIPTRELGGKNYEQQYASYSSPYQTPYGSRESFQPTATDNALSLREQYLLWDKGIGIPEPGDPDYNDYMKYLKSRGTSAQV